MAIQINQTTFGHLVSFPNSMSIPETFKIDNDVFCGFHATSAGDLANIVANVMNSSWSTAGRGGMKNVHYQ